MLYECLIVLIIFGLLQYYDNILHVLLIVFVLYLSYKYFISNKSEIYNQINDIINQIKPMNI